MANDSQAAYQIPFEPEMREPEPQTTDSAPLAASGDAKPIEYAGLQQGLSGQTWSFRSRRRLVSLALVSAILLPLQWLWMRLQSRFWWQVAGFWHRSALAIMGVRVVEVGQRAKKVRKNPAVYVANHISWLDILALGGRLPYASFVAKSDIQSWGFVGWMCTLHRTLFVNRERRSSSAKQANDLADRVRDGGSLIFFPEATSTLGTGIEPFKSSLFSVAQLANEGSDKPIRVQPISISYTRINNQPLTRARRPLVGWVGDVELLDHVIGIFNTERLTITIQYHPPVTLEEVGGRKQLARHCEAEIRAGLARLHRGEYRYGPQPGQA